MKLSATVIRYKNNESHLIADHFHSNYGCVTKINSLSKKEIYETIKMLEQFINDLYDELIDDEDDEDDDE